MSQDQRLAANAQKEGMIALGKSIEAAAKTIATAIRDARGRVA